MFGIKLKELRIEKGLTQQQLAEKLGYNQSMISFWEKEVNEPTESAIRKTAQFFGVSSDYLLGLED
ncbi:MAG: helix-turn-helix transcriptional regulator [Clostridia bacterium]|nr:helix-turn-helix transcriptional regulator [Clostridia bacterium]